MEGPYPAGSKSRAGLLRALVDFPEDLTYPREGQKRNINGGTVMRKPCMTLLIILFIQIGLSVHADQDLKVTTVMKGSTTISGQKIEYPKTDKAEMVSVLIEIQPGKESGRHMHPVPTYVHVLEGTLTVEFEDGSRQAFEAGRGFLEVMNTWHNGKNLGRGPLKFLIVFAGEEGKPNLIRPEKSKTSAHGKLIQ